MVLTLLQNEKKASNTHRKVQLCTFGSSRIIVLYTTNIARQEPATFDHRCFCVRFQIPCPRKGPFLARAAASACGSSRYSRTAHTVRLGNTLQCMWKYTCIYIRTIRYDYTVAEAALFAIDIINVQPSHNHCNRVLTPISHQAPSAYLSYE